MRGMRQKPDRRQGGHTAERHWKELPRHTQSLSPDAQSYRGRFPPPMTLWCHTARELFSVSGDAQDSRHPMLNGAPPAFPCPLRAHLSQLAQPGRTLLRRADRKADPPQQLPLYPTTRSRHPRLPRPPQQTTKALPLDKIRRRHPQRPRKILRANQRLRTLEMGSIDAWQRGSERQVFKSNSWPRYGSSL
jgi:hypothetical protein